MNPTNHYAYQFLAPVLLQVGDAEAYRRHRELTLHQFAQLPDLASVPRLARVCLILPPPPAELDTLAKMVDAAAAAPSAAGGQSELDLVRGLLAYRQGQFESAATAVSKVTPVADNPAIMVQAKMILAMAQFQAKQADAARATLATGLKLTEPGIAHPGGANWDDQIIARSLMHEARALIEPAPGDG